MSNLFRSLLMLAVVLFTIGFSNHNNKNGGTQVRGLSIDKDAHIAIIGNTLADRLQEDGWLETYITERYPGRVLTFRNLGFSADQVNLSQREEAFGTPEEWLSHVEADIVFAFSGFNESFADEAGLAKFKTDMTDFVRKMKETTYNGKTSPQLVLFSPIANENLTNKFLPDRTGNNKRIEIYSKVISEIAEKENVSFVDLYSITKSWYANNTDKEPYTVDGVHLNRKGNKALAKAIDNELFGKSSDHDKNKMKLLNDAIKDKDWHWFNKYRITDRYNVYGGRYLNDYKTPREEPYTYLGAEEAIKKMTVESEADKYRVVYKGQSGPGLGKKIVFISSDHEYRSEESLPALARILAKRYGFTCTVVWALDEKGNILPGSSDIKGLDVLNDADLMVIFTRFADFPDEEMQHIDDYLKRGGPVMGFRTATHAFNIKNHPKWQHYDYGYKGPMEEWKGGFGELILGETWVGHYGTNHKQASKLIIEDAEKDHPIMRGVKDPWAQSGGYNAYPEKMGSTVLARGKILNGMTPDAPADTSKQMLPVAWVRNYKLKSGATGRAFATTHGASEDLLSEGFRRMAINAAFWCMGMESVIKPNNNIDFVGPYKPTTFNFSGYKANVKPSDLAGWESLIMPGEVVKPVK